ncbi:hypothetical protein V2J09_016983 [Rumex salicifolius]
MEEARPVTPVAGSRHSILNKSFKVGVRSLLTACPKEEFLEAFSGFTVAEQERLYGLFIQRKDFSVSYVNAVLYIQNRMLIQYLRTQKTANNQQMCTYELDRTSHSGKDYCECQRDYRITKLDVYLTSSTEEYGEDEFESVCLETQAGMTLDTVEQLVEEQSVDPLYSDKTNIGNIKHEFSAAREIEAQLLESLLAKAEDHKLRTEARIELLKKNIENASNATGAVEKLRSDVLKYSAYTSNGQGLL